MRKSPLKTKGSSVCKEAGCCFFFSWHHPAVLSLLEEATFLGRIPPWCGAPVLGKAGPIPAADE